MKPVLKSRAAKLLQDEGRSAELFEKPVEGRLKINRIPVVYAYLGKQGVVVAKGEDGRYYSDVEDDDPLIPKKKNRRKRSRLIL